MFMRADSTEGSMYIGPPTVHGLLFYIKEELDGAEPELKVV